MRGNPKPLRIADLGPLREVVVRELAELLFREEQEHERREARRRLAGKR